MDMDVDVMYTENMLSPTSDKKSTVCNKYFECLGKISLSEELHFHPDSFIVQNEFNTIFKREERYDLSINNLKIITLFNYKFHFATGLQNHSKILFNLARKNFLLLHESSISSNYLEKKTDDRLSYFELRVQITELLYNIRMFINQITQSELNFDVKLYCKPLIEEVQAFRKCLNNFSCLPGYIIRHSVSHLGNKCTQANYHLFHGHLEWRWHHLLFIYEFIRYQNIVETDNTEKNDRQLLEEYLLLFLADLMAIAIEIYQKTQISDLINTTPFSCSCVKECWLLLQLFIDELSLKRLLKEFWFYIDLIFNKYDKIPKTRETSNSSELSTEFKCNDVNGFGIWFIINIAQLHGFTKNGQFIGQSSNRVIPHYGKLESLLKNAINENISEISLHIYIALISDVTTMWWEPKNDILALLWEYFQKKLNNPFVQCTTLKTVVVSSNTALGYLNEIKQRLSNSNINVHESSYKNFLYLLGKHFTRCKKNGEVSHWQRFKGRIYSKLTPNKIFALTEMGLINLTTLFLTLAISVDIKEVGLKLEELLSQLSYQKLDATCKIVIIKTHLSIIMLSIENDIDIGYTTKSLLELVNSLCTGSSIDNINSVLAVYIEGLGDIIEISQNFQLSEYHLIDIWIPKYLSKCNQTGSSRLLDILMKVLLKLFINYKQTFLIENQNMSIDIETPNKAFRNMTERLLQYVLPFIRQIATTSNTITQVADLAMYLTLLSLYDKSLYMKYEQKFLLLFKYFSQNENVNIRIARRYLVKILVHEDVKEHLRVDFPCYEINLVQSWVKCCFLCYDELGCQEMKDFFMMIYDFENVKFLRSLSNFPFEDADDTLCALLITIGVAYNATSDFQEKNNLRNLLNSYLGMLETHVLPLMKNPTSLELTLRVYSIISVLFLHCSSLLYTRSKPSCLLHILLSQLVLPPALFMDKDPHPYIITAMRKTWHLFFKGLFSLNHKTDPYIEKALKDLIVVYIPHFGICNKSTMERYATSQPIHELLCDKDTSEVLINFMYEKIHSNFLICRGKQVNKNSVFVLTILADLIKKNSNDSRLISSFLVNLGIPILENLMFLDELSPSRKIVYNIIETIVSSSIFKTDIGIRNDFSTCVVKLSEKHLAFCANHLFRLLNRLTEIVPFIIENILQEIRNLVAFVESRRGVGYDKGLRKALENLENLVQKIKLVNMENIAQ